MNKTYEMTPEEIVNCPIYKTMEIFQGKWNAWVLFELGRNETIRFGELKKAIPGISNTVLSTTLKDLEERGLVTRIQYNEIPPHVEYTASESAKDLKDIFQAMFRDVPLHTIYDVYIDVMSGAHTEPRPAYQRMLNDCRNNKLDLIVCKSISRFGRNTEEMLKTIREIKQYGVNVYFQLENMNTSDSTSEHIMTVISAFREEENRSRRQNVRRGIVQKATTGTSKYYTKPCYGYRRDDTGNLVVYEPEAENVRLIFDAYLQGATISQLIQLLETRQIPSPTGKEKWCRRSVDQLLENEKYIGDVILMKTYTPEVGAKRRKNRGESEQYEMTDGHPPIITREAYAAVQEEKKRRSNVEIVENAPKRTGRRYMSKFSLQDYLKEVSE